jgi:predicted lipoprotein with Yx(FWY)xxD motif
MGNQQQSYNSPQYDISTNQLNIPGSYLVGKNGMTLYAYTKDAANASVCYADCEAKWPPLLVTNQPMTNGINNGMLKTTQRSDGSMQLTYNNWPLYYYYMDQVPGEIKGQGVDSVWYIVKPDGNLLVTPH